MHGIFGASVSEAVWWACTSPPTRQLIVTEMHIACRRSPQLLTLSISAGCAHACRCVASVLLGRALASPTLAVHLCIRDIMLRATSRILSRTKNVFRILTTSRSFPHIRQYSVPTLPSSRCTVTAIATCIVFSQSPGLQLYSYRRIGATTLTGYRSSEDQDLCRSNPRNSEDPQRVRRESEDFNVGGNKREPAVPLRRRNIGTKG